MNTDEDDESFVVVLEEKPVIWWTVLAGGLVAWNVLNWHRPKYHLSRLARQHPVIASGFIGSYIYHFFFQGSDWEKRIVLRKGRG